MNRFLRTLYMHKWLESHLKDVYVGFYSKKQNF